VSAFPNFRFGAGQEALTLLLITPTRLIRADFHGRREPALRHIWEARAPAGETVPLLAEAAFLLGPPRKCDVFVLSTSVSCQILSVPASKVNGLEGEELSNALSFEAEAMSGINPFDSALAAQPAGANGQDRTFWVSQMSLADLGQIQSSLDERKANLRGMAHPAGLPRPLGTALAGWQRVELWNDLVMAIDGSHATNPRMNVLNGSPGRGLWQNQVDQWFGPEPRDRAVMIADSSMIQFASGPTVSLDEEPILKAWLQQWAVEALQDKVRIPLVRPAPKPMPDAQRWALAAGLTLGACGICLGHYFFIQHQERVLARALEAAKRPAQDLAVAKGNADRLQTELEAVNREMRDIHDLRQFWKDTLDKEHRRHATLLGTLALATPVDLAITTIDEAGGELRLSGLSMTPEVAGFATNMATALEPFGWRIEPPRRRALNIAADGGPWLLDWSLRSVTPMMGPRTNGPAATVTAGGLQSALTGAAALITDTVPVEATTATATTTTPGTAADATPTTPNP
jgi:hypothetical protein